MGLVLAPVVVEPQRMRVRRGLTRLVLVGFFGVLLGVVPLPFAQADCVGPLLGVGPSVDDVEPPENGVLPAAGTAVTVSGVWFHTGCDDAGEVTGCSATSSEAPMRDVDLVLEQGAKLWVIGTESAAARDDQYAVLWSAAIPADVQQGPAILRAGGAELPVTIASR